MRAPAHALTDETHRAGTLIVLHSFIQLAASHLQPCTDPLIRGSCNVAEQGALAVESTDMQRINATVCML